MAALKQWHELFNTTLTDMGFEINLYDRCVANKMVNRKQCTMIVCYIDDCKISHAKQGVIIDEIIAKLEENFGKFHGISKGKKHSYHGINLDLHDDGIEMEDAIRQVIEDFSEDIRGDITSPASKKLLVNTESVGFSASFCTKILSRSKRDINLVGRAMIWI